MTLSPTLHRTLELTLTWLRLTDLLNRSLCGTETGRQLHNSVKYGQKDA